MLMTCCEAKSSSQQGRTSHTSRDREKQCPNTAEMKNKAKCSEEHSQNAKSYQKQNKQRKKATQKYTQEKRGIIFR